MTTKTNAAKCAEEIYYQPQERAFAPGIVKEWPNVIPHPTDPNGRLVKKHFPPSAEEAAMVPEMCPSCEDRCGGTELYSYCPCCENFVGPTPPHWYHGPRGVPVSKLKALKRHAANVDGGYIESADLDALIAEVGSS